MPKNSFLGPMLRGKCPRCHHGDIFTYSASNIAKFNIMNTTCPQCGVRLEPEPGFYQGAMYVGYAFTVSVLALVGLLLFFTWDPSEWTYIGIIVGIMVLLIPLNYRYSRILYLYMFGGISYQP
ncbi:MAG: DUF983 domain-containing protein [Chryseolinea sp.]